MKSEIVKKEKYDNCVKLTARFEEDGETHKQRFGFSYSQIENDNWKEHIEKWEEEIKKDINLDNI